MKTLFLISAVLFGFSAFSQEYSTALMAAKMDLDSAWYDHEMPAPDKICLPQESHVLRKGISKHDCLKMAMGVAMKEGAEAAIPWLTAAFCYEQPAQDRVSKAGPEAVRYVMNQWGDGQAAIAGAVKSPAAVVAAKPVELTINFTNKTGDWLYMYGLMSDEADGERNCREYKYIGKLAPNRSHLQVVSKGRYTWMRFSNEKANDGCGTFKKEHKIGPAADQTLSSSTEIFIQ
jgi:hypothetical protein